MHQVKRDIAGQLLSAFEKKYLTQVFQLSESCPPISAAISLAATGEGEGYATPAVRSARKRQHNLHLVENQPGASGCMG